MFSMAAAISVPVVRNCWAEAVRPAPNIAPNSRSPISGASGALNVANDLASVSAMSMGCDAEALAVIAAISDRSATPCGDRDEIPLLMG